jgi:V/A-type H+/Na+-transporting ATPase subunit K
MIMFVFFAVLVGLVPMIPAVIYFIREQKTGPTKATRGLLMGLTGFNVVIGLMAAGLGFLWLASPHTVMASGLVQAAATSDPYAALAAGIATGLGSIGAGMAVSGTGAAAIGAIAEKPEAFGRSLIFVGMAEGIAIYGLIISFMVLNR